MVWHKEQVVRVQLNDDAVAMCQQHARAADTRGKTNIDRDHQWEYQLTGQLSEAALFYHFGQGLEAYHRRRTEINKHPEQGDGGFDLIVDGLKVDVKGTYPRTAKDRTKTLSEYHLYVREAERTADRYVFALVQPERWNLVGLIGWWPDYLFNGVEAGSPRLQGDRFQIGVPLLYPMATWDRIT